MKKSKKEKERNVIIDTYNANNAEQNIPIFNSGETEYAISKYDMEEYANTRLNNAYNIIELANRPKTYEELLLERDKLNVSMSVSTSKSNVVSPNIKSFDINKLIEILHSIISPNDTHFFVFQLEHNVYKCIFCDMANMDILYYAFDLYLQIFPNIKLDLTKSKIIIADDLIDANLTDRINDIKNIKICIWDDNINFSHKNSMMDDILLNINEYLIFNDIDFANLEQILELQKMLQNKISKVNQLLMQMNELLTIKFNKFALNCDVSMDTIINNTLTNHVNMEYVVLYNTYFNKLLLYNNLIPEYLIKLSDFKLIRMITHEEYKLLTTFCKKELDDYDEDEDIHIIQKYIEKCIVDANVRSKDDKVITIIKNCYYISDDISHKIKFTDVHKEIVKYIPNMSAIKLADYLKKAGLNKKRYNDGIYWFGMIPNNKMMLDLLRILN